jgi:hypothetical protein
MIDRQSLRKMCEYEYAPSLVGEAILDWRKETARERADRIWRMDHGRKAEAKS